MKPVIRQSKLKNYFDCQRKYAVSLDSEIKQTRAMAMGNVFESLVFSEEKEILEWDQINKLISKATKEALEIYAKPISEMFIEGEPFYKLSYESDKYILNGEADYIGKINYQGKEYEGIIDLKFTGDIHRVWGLSSKCETFGVKDWNNKTRKADYLQAMAYPYMIAKKTGELKNFYYLLVESQSLEDMRENEPVTMLLDVSPTAEDIEWFEKTVDEILDDIFLPPNYGHCLECQYFKTGDCSAGRKKFGELERINLEFLS
jgi:hypothetical protein